MALVSRPLRHLESWSAAPEGSVAWVSIDDIDFLAVQEEDDPDLRRQHNEYQHRRRPRYTLAIYDPYDSIIVDTADDKHRHTKKIVVLLEDWTVDYYGSQLHEQRWGRQIKFAFQAKGSSVTCMMMSQELHAPLLGSLHREAARRVTQQAADLPRNAPHSRDSRRPAELALRAASGIVLLLIVVLPLRRTAAPAVGPPYVQRRASHRGGRHARAPARAHHRCMAVRHHHRARSLVSLTPA